MADKTPDQEPSIEEILASIRQIISDDERDDAAITAAPEAAVAEEKPAPVAPPAQPQPVREEVVAAAPEPEDEDILDLTSPIVDVPDDDDNIALEEFAAAPEPVAPPPAPPAPKPEPKPAQRAIPSAPVRAETAASDFLSEEARRAALNSMARLTGNMPISRPRDNGGVTLEDLVRDMLSPMLRDWMSDNLPPMVERIVQKELEKLARQAQDV